VPKCPSQAAELASRSITQSVNQVESRNFQENSSLNGNEHALIEAIKGGVKDYRTLAKTYGFNIPTISKLMLKYSPHNTQKS